MIYLVLPVLDKRDHLELRDLPPLHNVYKENRDQEVKLDLKEVVDLLLVILTICVYIYIMIIMYRVPQEKMDHKAVLGNVGLKYVI